MHSKSLSFIKKYDLSFFTLATIIFIIGISNLYSATYTLANNQNLALYKAQIIWFLLSLFCGIAVSFIRPKTYFQYSYFIYAVTIVLLILVMVLGTNVLGAKRWLNLGVAYFQPSELAKVSIVLALSRWYSTFKPEEDIGLKEMIVPLILTLVPTVLIIIEPDLGTGLIIFLIFFIVTFYCRLKWKTIVIICIMGLFVGGIMYQFGLKKYQKQRIITFLDPWGDARGHGYNAIQSEIAIGSGQLFGKGFKKSSQASLRYLPENHTDFVFSIFNEEHGFFGSLILLILYVILLLRFISVATSVLNFYDSILSIGLMSIFFWHIFINMAMVTGLFPIVGLPLPFMSYGGSSLLTFGICCGMATAVSNSKNLF